MIGDDSIILDGRGEPACVIKTGAAHGALRRVTAEMAAKEGEGDKSGVLARGASGVLYPRGHFCAGHVAGVRRVRTG